MRDIEPISEYGQIDVQDVRDTVQGLPPGTYASVDLYARYTDLAQERDHLPGHQVSFGQTLGRLGARRTKKTIGGAGRGKLGRGHQVAAWFIW